MTFESLYAVIGIPVIFILGFAGSLIPPLVSMCWPSYNITKKYYFSFFNGIASGVILAVGWIHSLADAQDAFSTALTEDDYTDTYPWANWIAMMAVLILFTIEELMAVVANRFGIVSIDPHFHGGAEDFLMLDGSMGDVHSAKGHIHTHTHTHTHSPHHDHACDHTIDEHLENDGQCDAQPLEEACDHHNKPGETSSSEEEAATDLEAPSSAKSSSSSSSISKKKKVMEPLDVEKGEGEEVQKSMLQKRGSLGQVMKMLLLFIGLDIHNIFVGLALGIADNDYVLFIALLFHQFFEGLGMGSRVAMAKLRRLATVMLIDLIFSLTPVIFIGVGIGIKQGVQNADDTNGYNIAKGSLQAMSAGILVYIALVHMMRAYTENGASPKHRDYHAAFSFFGLLFGAAIMSVIGIWA